jgi:putative phage-type endonuclease
MSLTDEQHEERSQGLGGSDSPVVLGVSPYKSRYELALEKLRLMPESQVETAPMRRGKVMEPLVAEIYAETTGRIVTVEPMSLVHPKHDFIRGNIDRWVYPDDDRRGGVLEIKCPGLAVFGKCKREGLSEAWQVQLQHYLALTGAEWGSFAVHNGELWELLWFDVKRDDELIDMILTEDTKFWEMIQAGEMPEDTMPALDLPPVGKSDLIKIDSAEWTRAVAALREAKEITKAAEALETEAKEEIKKLMPGPVVEGSGLRAYLSEQAGRITYDVNRVFHDYPEIPKNKYAKRGKPFTSMKTYFLKERES